MLTTMNRPPITTGTASLTLIANHSSKAPAKPEALPMPAISAAPLLLASRLLR